MQSAQVALEIAQKKLADCTVKAPMSGEVAAKNIAVGDIASPQVTAVTLIDAQKMIVHINVTETNISRVKIGMAAEIKVQALNAVSKGIVVSVAPACDAKTVMFPVEIQVNNEDGKLKPGMIADITLADGTTGEPPQQGKNKIFR